jgi:hypothetical protein
VTRDSIKASLAGLVLLSCYAIANDPPSVSDKDKSMRECRLTQAAVETVCKNEKDAGYIPQ